MRLFAYTTILLILFAAVSCTKIKSDTHSQVVQLGSFALLPDSRNAIPYYGNQGVRFVDSLGNEMSFQISVSSGTSLAGCLVKHDVFEPGDSVQYCYTVNGDVIWLINTESARNINFQLILHPLPYYPDPESGSIADILDIWFYTAAQPPNPDARQVFNMTVNQRTYPQISDANTLIPSIQFNGMLFSSVQKTNFSMPASDLYYNTALGIVAFTDHAGKLWRFKEMF